MFWRLSAELRETDLTLGALNDAAVMFGVVTHTHRVAASAVCAAQSVPVVRWCGEDVTGLTVHCTWWRWCSSTEVFLACEVPVRFFSRRGGEGGVRNLRRTPFRFFLGEVVRLGLLRYC